MLDEVVHLLLAIWGEDIYESQIEEVIGHYGSEVVKEAEVALYSSRVFELILN